MSVNQGLLVGDIINLTTPKGKAICNAKIIRIAEWSPIPFKLEWRGSDGKIRHESFDLNKCQWYLREPFINIIEGKLIAA